MEFLFPSGLFGLALYPKKSARPFGSAAHFSRSVYYDKKLKEGTGV